MKANFRTCPQCSTRNRLDKEFCVKCGEPLEGIKAGDPSATQPGTGAGKKGKPGFFVSREGEEGQSPLVPFVVVLLTLGVAFIAWRQLQGESATATVAAAPAAPRTQASIPPVVVSSLDPAVQAYTAGMAALRAGDFANAVRLLREAVAARNRADYRLGLADALEKSGTTSEALAEYEAATEAEGANVRHTAEWAKALNRAGRSTEAIRAYEAAVQLDSENLANVKELANLYLKANDFTKARPHLEKVVALQPGDLVPKQSLARALESARDYEGAAQQYRDILESMPDATVSRALLSEVLMRQNRPSEALATLDEGIALDPNAGVLYREKGRVYDRLGRSAEAVAAYREYVRLSPGASDIRNFTDRIAQLSQD